MRALPSSSRSSLVSHTTFKADFSTLRPSPQLLDKSPAIIEERARVHEDEEASREVSAGDGDQEAATESKPASDDVPWYLQVEAPKHPTLLHEPPPLPDIPEGAPKVMEPLLKFVSDELGFDDLTLLDLREMDPPAALGPDLLMIFGTARSERHLHISADRLVRWLRSRGMSADADGLLGRNELKVKLRRKARKAKLLGATGAVPTADDGITTGWICVNMGTIGWSDKEVEFLDAEGNPAGFGNPQTGTTIVVQMLTESRRQELNLEKLWKDMLRRSLEANGKAVKQPVQREALSTDNFFSGGGAGSSSRREPPSRRFYSTLAPPADTAAPVGGSILEQVLASKAQLRSAKAGEPVLDGMSLPFILAHDTQSKLQVIEKLKQYLGELPREEAEQVFEPGENRIKGPFMRLFNRAVENLPSEQAMAAQLWLETSKRLQHLAGARLTDLQTLIKDIQLSGSILNRRQYLSIIRAIFDAVPVQELDDASVRTQSALAMEVIDLMFVHGEEVLSIEVVATVIESVVRSGAVTAQVPEAVRLLAQFEALLHHQAGLPCPEEHLLMQLLAAYADHGLWDGFWRVWNVPPRYQKSRSSVMYAWLYRRLARDGHQARCIDALRRTTNEMQHESPPVAAIGSVLEGLKACMLVADPGVQNIAESVEDTGNPPKGSPLRREFVKLWKKLVRR